MSGALRMTATDLAAYEARRRGAAPSLEAGPGSPGAGWQDAVLRLAAAGGWSHRHSHGEMDGFPRLVLVSPAQGRVLFVETLSEAGRLTAAQRGWRDALLAAGVEWHCWKPDETDAAVAALSPRRGGLSLGGGG